MKLLYAGEIQMRVGSTSLTLLRLLLAPSGVKVKVRVWNRVKVWVQVKVSMFSAQCFAMMESDDRVQDLGERYSWGLGVGVG